MFNLFSCLKAKISPANTTISDTSGLKTLKTDVAELVRLDKEKKLKNVENVMVVSHYAGKDEYPVANLNKYELRQVMAVVYFNDIPGLSLEHCQLNDELVYELGLCVRENGSLRRLSFCNDDITPSGMNIFLHHTSNNNGLESLTISGSSLDNYKWQLKEVTSLAMLVAQHKTLKTINLPFNGFDSQDHEESIRTLMKPYQEITDRGLATVTMNFFGETVFDRANILNGTLEAKANIKIMGIDDSPLLERQKKSGMSKI
jgi:hypothetical protein